MKLTYEQVCRMNKIQIDIFKTFDDPSARLCELCMLGKNEWEEMRELLTAKANVDRLLNMEAEHGAEKKKDHAQR